MAHNSSPVPSKPNKMATVDPLTPGQFQFRLLLGIGLAVLAWGTYLAAGAAMNSGERSLMPLLKGVIILACFSGFLGLWALLLWTRKPRRTVWEEREDAADSDDQN